MSLAIPEHGGLGHAVAGWQADLVLPDTVERDVVLEVPTDTWKMLQHWNSVLLELLFVADAGEHEHLRCVDRAERQHHFVPGPDVAGDSSVDDLDTAGTPSLEGDPVDVCQGEDGQVGPVEMGKDVGAEYRLALAVADAQVGECRSTGRLHHCAVRALERRNADRTRTLHRGRRQRIG